MLLLLLPLGASSLGVGEKLELIVVGLNDLDPRGLVGGVFVAMVVESVIVRTFCASAVEQRRRRCHRLTALLPTSPLIVLIVS